MTDSKAKNIEIERKFLVTSRDWPTPARSLPIAQGYLADQNGLSLRVRQKGKGWYLTVKVARDSLSRHEFEYEIPADEGTAMLALCTRAAIMKVRHEVMVGAHLWEIDVFEGANEGLVLAEIELSDPDEAFERPGWLGAEVTQDPRYGNAQLYQYPYSQWT